MNWRVNSSATAPVEVFGGEEHVGGDDAEAVTDFGTEETTGAVTTFLAAW